MKISKLQRQNAVKEVIRRWGRLKKATIDENICNIFGLEADEGLKRAIYRDLEDLVTSGEIDILYFTRDGILIEDFNPSVHKNFYNEWTSKDFTGGIFGQSLLNIKSAGIYVSSILRNEIMVSEKGEISQDKNYIFFYLNSHYINISFKHEIAPLKIIISRFVDAISDSEINEVEKKIGKRFIILKVPSNSVSAFKSNESLGHLMLEFKPERLIQLRDLGAKNGSDVFKLTPEEADEIRLKGKALIEETVTVSWDSIPAEMYVRKHIENSIDSYAPFIVELGSRFRLLVI